MADRVFTLRVPVEAEYRALATEVVSRYFDLIGRVDPDRAAVTTAFAAALERVASESRNDSGDGIEVSCTGGAERGELQLRCGARSAVVPYPGARAAR